MALVCKTGGTQIECMSTVCMLSCFYQENISDFRAAYHSAYLREGTGIREQYYIYCSPILMLRAGIGFEGLRGGHKKCPVFNGTHVARVANGPLALSGLCRGDVTRLQLETRYIKSPCIGLYNRCREFCLTSLSSLGRARETHRKCSRR